MAARKPKAEGLAKTERTSTTRGKTFQEAVADESAEKQAAADSGAPQVDESKGYFGETPDPTPNENYTVSGVLAGKPVPEVDGQ